MYLLCDLKKLMSRLYSKELALLNHLNCWCSYDVHKMYHPMELIEHEGEYFQFNESSGKFSLKLYFQKSLFNYFNHLLYLLLTKIFCLWCPLKQPFFTFFLPVVEKILKFTSLLKYHSVYLLFWNFIIIHSSINYFLVIFLNFYLF